MFLRTLLSSFADRLWTGPKNTGRRSHSGLSNTELVPNGRMYSVVKWRVGCEAKALGNREYFVSA